MNEIEEIIDNLITQSYMAGWMQSDTDKEDHNNARELAARSKRKLINLLKQKGVS